MKDFLSELIKKDIHINLLEGELSVKFPKSGTDRLILEEIRSRKDAIVEYLHALKGNSFALIPALAVAGHYPISDAQRRLWVLSQFEGGSEVYNIPGTAYLNQEINIDCFKNAIAATIERHEILRTVFKEDETGEIRQWVLNSNDLGFTIDYKDFRKAKNKEEQVRDYITEDSYQAFDLEKGPLLRAALLRTGDEDYVFYYNTHHIISDGWSMEVLTKDVLAYYDAYKNNQQPQLKELRIQYKDYSAWQLSQLKEESFKAHKAYWLERLKGELPLLNLPTTKQRPRIKTNNGHGLGAYIDRDTTAQLKKYSEAHGGSLFMGLLAAWNILIYRYTSLTDIITGTPTAGREHADLEDQIGFYVNTLALRNELKPADNFDELFLSVKQNTLNAYAHQMYPFDRLVEDLNLARDTSRSVVFDIMLILQNNGENINSLALKKEDINKIADLGQSKSKFDIEIVVQETGDYLSLNMSYNPDVYERDLVEDLIRHYKQLLNAVLENPKEKISQIDYLSEKEKDELLITFNDTKTDYAKDKSITDLFEAQATKTPDAIALVFKEKELTYKELNEQSNQLANYLQKNYQIQPDDLVGIKLERTEWMIISILAVLKSGGAYVPIDPEYPQERIDYIVADTQCKVCIDAAELSKFKKDQKKYATKKVISKTTADHLAYVIYTSGSTGKPKGVMIGHKSLSQFLNHALAHYYTGETIIQPFVSSSAFDISVFELFLPLLTGGQSILVSKEDFQDNTKFAKLLSASTVMHTVPAMYETIVNHIKTEGTSGSFSGIKKIFVGGDKVSDQILQSLAEVFSSADVTVLYGPTEGTIFCTDCVYKKEETKTKSNQIYNGSIIGTPNNNVSIYILNEAGALAPKGVAGEICIGGEGLAKGYLNQPALTKEKFIPNPFKAGEKIYKTGDLGRWTKEGKIEFAGRKDDQVKIRGYRIELGEIEHALLKHEQIEAAVVVAKTNEQNEKELVAYIVSKEEQTTTGLRDYLKELLPEYMLPAYYVQLEALPLTSNGKVDKKALPDPQGLGLSSGVEYVAPRTEQEKILVSVWRDVLKREAIGIKDSFYNLGGDSIKSIQVVSRLKQQGYALKVENILRTPVLEELARLVQQSTQVIDQSEVKGLVELTPVQKSFFEEPGIKTKALFNQSVLLQSKEPLDKNVLEKSIAELARHHDALRMVYKDEAGVWKQINQDTTAKSYAINFYDLSKADNALEQMAQLGEELQASINITEGLLFKVIHFRLKDGDRLGLIIHHLVVDGVSWRILLEDLSALYTNYKAGKKAELPLKTDSFQKWAQLQKEYAQGNKIKNEKAYWEALCSQEIPGLPQDKKIKTSGVPNIDSSLSFTLDKKITELLQTRVHGVYNTEINDVLLTGLGLAIKEVFLRDRSVLKMEGHGREEIIEGVDISRTVGWFTTTYPFVLHIPGAAHPTESLTGVKESLRRVPNKGIGYGILKYLSQEGINNKLNPEIVFNYLGDFGTNAGESGNDKKSVFDYASESIGSGVDKAQVNDAILDVSGMLVMGELNMSVSYSQARYDAATIKKLVRSYEKNLKSLITELSKSKTTHLTPSDLSFKELGAEELAEINAGGMLEDVYELSPLQEGIYYHWLSDPSGSLYFEQMSYRVRAKGLNIKNLERAYDHLIARHGVLRTSFSNDYAGRSLQIVRKKVPGNFTYEKIKANTDKQIYVGQAKIKDREKGFDLSGPSQMRLHIIDLGEGEYEFIWSHHHILMDGWCMSVLIGDFNQLLSGNKSALSPAMPYANYIHWLNEIDRESSLAYWKSLLAGYSEVAGIPFKIKAEEKSYVESKEHLQINGELFKKVDALCHQAGITQSTFLQGVWGYLLSCYNNTNDVVFGAVVSGRPAELPGVEEMIGLFINTIPVRVKYESNNTPVELLKALQEQSIQSTSHHYMNLSEVQSQSEPGKNLLDHIMIFENYAVKELTGESILTTQKEEGLSIEAMEVFEQTNYDFNITVGPSATALSVDIKYNVNRYDGVSMKKLKDHFNNLVIAFAEHAHQPLHTLNYLSEAEKHELLVTFNDTAVEYPKDKTITGLFAEQAAKTPSNIAVAFEENTLSYQQLDELSNQLADYLQKNYAIQPDDLVGIKQDKSEWMIVSILGVLKSGGAYVPIDPGYPQERIDYIEKDTTCKVCIDETELSRFRKNQTKYSKKEARSATRSNNLVYVIYTSGSTGQPKGVLVEHSGVVNRLLWMRRDLKLDEQDVFLQKTPVTFDVSVWELFLPLITGSKLVIPRPEGHKDPVYLEQIINNFKISILHFVPSMLSGMLDNIQWDALKNLRHVVCSGEALPKKLENLFREKSPVTQLHNYYGPTEASVDVTAINLTQFPTTRDEVSIGKPVDNTRIYIVNDMNALQPLEVLGEILLGGVQIARGYLNKEALTKEKFIASPFKANERLYKTGDLGRWLPDGTIEYAGRKDNQVKIRGNRIELGEIEHALQSHKEIKEAVVLAKDNQNKEKELVAYITATAALNTGDLRNYLKAIVPVYMLPAYYVQLEAMPLNANGKTDRKLLPNPQGLGLSSGVEYVAPGNEAEEKLAVLWREVLGIEKENIGIKDRFFDLGGDSIKVLRLMAGLRKKLGYHLSVADIYNNDTIEKIAAYAADHKKDIDVKNKEREELEKNARYEIEALKERILSAHEISNKENIEDLYPMSDIEKGMVFGYIMNEGTGTYHDQMVFQRSFPQFNIERFQRALALLTHKHSILRTGFNLSDYECEVQIVYKKVDNIFEFKDLSDLSKQNQEEIIKAYLASERARGFIVSQAPLWRMSAFGLGQDHYAFVFQFHHAIIDGWSNASFMTELNNLYLQLEADIHYKPAQLKASYKDFIVDHEMNRRDETIKDFWKKDLFAYERLDLFTEEEELGKYSRLRDNNYLKSIEHVAKNLNTTVKVVSLSAYLYLLKILNYNAEIVTGLVTNTRPAVEDGDKILGCFLNTIPLKVQVDGHEQFSDLIRRVHEKLIELKNNEKLSTLAIASIGQEKPGTSNPFFDVLFSYVDFHAYQDVVETELNEENNSGGSAIDLESYERTNTFFDFTVSTTGGMYLVDLGTTKKFKSGLSVNYIGDLYFKILDFILKDANKLLNDIDYLSEKEKHEQLFTFNATAAGYPKNKTIIDLFSEQVTKNPGGIAVAFEENTLSYQQLDELSNQLAHYLEKNYAVQPDDLVGIKLERSEWMIVSILAVLKSGGAYVPIDPSYPQERIDYIEKDTSCKVCIDEHELNRFRKNQTKYAATKITSAAKPGNLAYVIYTSGSTGQPKGVMIEHGNVVRLLKTEAPLFDFSSSDVWTMFHSYAFDFSVWEMYGALLFGGKLVVVAKPVAQDTALYLALLEREGVTVLNQTPSAFYNLSKEEKKSNRQLSVRYVIFGGEALSPGKLQHWRDRYPSCLLINMYGITETTVHTTYKEIGQEEITLNRSNIGKAIPTVSCMVLDENKNLVPIGVTGELYIGGKGVARGYLNRAELTGERFVAHPFAAGERLYRTGDKARQLANGDFEYLGRIDNQVKIRGHRIELGEIEQALLRNEQIAEAVVLAKKNDQDENELVAYITAKAEQNINALRSYLKEFLPAYMLPAHYVQLEALPLTGNGKVDKKALPDPQGLDLASGVEYVAPRTEQEKILVSVWHDVLKREAIGIKDSFYNLGGDSIKSIQVVSRLKQQGYTLKVEQILRTPVLEELAMLMQQSTQVIDQSEVKGEVGFTPIQKWFFGSSEIKVHAHFNQSVLLQSKEQLDKNVLEKSIAELARHHDALRMVYKNEAGVWKQINQDTTAKSYTINFYDLSKADDAPGQMSKLGEALQSRMDLGEGPLFKVIHFRLKDGDRLGLIIHHLVVDGVSWRILLEDLSALYTNYKAGKKAELPLKTDSFQKWAQLQKEYAQGNKIKNEKAYWEALCSQEIPGLPQDKKIEPSAVANIDASLSFTLDKKITELLQTRVHGVYNTEINDVLLTGLGLAIKEVFSRNKSVLKMEGHGREEIIEGVDISRTVGWFTTMYPFVLDVSKSSGVAESLVEVKESLRRIPNKGIGYGILNYLSDKAPGTGITPEIVFNYLGDFGSNAAGSSDDKKSVFDYASESIGPGMAKENGSADAVLDVSGMLVMGELSMSVSYSQLRYDATTIKKLVKAYEKNLKALIKELSNKKETHLTPSDLSFKGLSVEELAEINPDNTVEDVYELSPLQEGIYYHWLSEASGSLYLEQMSYRIKAKGLNIKNLERAYDHLIARHGVLRTSFSNDYADRSLQIVRKAVPGNFTYEKITGKQNKESYVEQVKQKDRERGFDLGAPSQMRLHMIDLGKGEYEFIWSHHHILMDGWCMSVLINDFNQLLTAETLGTRLALAPAMPYSNYINWIKIIDKESSLRYWKSALAGYSEVAEIPFKIKAEDKSYAESREQLQINGELFKKVDALCHQAGITQNTFLQGVWGYLLSRYNNTKDVVFGAVVSGRPADLPGVEDMIGLFINTIPVRVKYESHQSPVELLKTLQEQAIQSTSHHYMNLSEVQSQSEPGKNLLDHIMIFENYAVKEMTGENTLSPQKEAGLLVESMEVFERTNYDFNIMVKPSSAALNIDVVYNSNRYESASLKHLKVHFNNLITAFAEHADEPLHTLNYLSEAEKHELLLTFNDTAADCPKNKTITDLFAEQVIKTPDDIAIAFEENTLSYQQLDELSNQLAAYLQKNYAIQPDDLVGIKLERSEWMIVSILGVLKSGGAYVPIDPGYPQERIDYIEKDTKCKVCIDEIELSRFRKSQTKYSKKEVTSATGPGNLAYVIYTSGSTGQPKGVMVEHHSLVSFMLNFRAEFGLGSVKKIAGSTNLTFDISLLEIFGALCHGKELIILSTDELNDPHKFLEKIEKSKVEGLQLTPSRLSQIYSVAPGFPKGISLVLVGGEELSKVLYERLKNESFKSINVYGPTEATIWSTSLNIPGSQSLSIGHPLLNEQVYILSEEDNLQPIGVAGEICIGGAGLARGYLNQEKLTKEKFIANPFKAGERLYKTGDLGRWLPGGHIEFAGRKDQQVKLRGYRIELGEIEHALLKHEQVEEAVVLAKSNQNNEKELVAYIVSKAGQNASDLRAYLKEILPKYMLPSHYVQLEELPLNTSGKTDRKALPDPQGLGLGSGTAYVAPGNETEEKLVKIWQAVLQKENIGIKDDFFALGGHSLKAVRLSNEYGKALNVKLSLKDLFAHTSIEAHAALIQSSKRSGFMQIEKVALQASYPISDAQRRLWVMSQFEGGSAAYNMPARMYLNQEINIDYFKKAIDATIERHEILRTVFREDEANEIKQWILNSKDLGFKIDYQDLRKEKNKNEKVSAYIAEDSYKAFDLVNGPLLRAGLIRVEDEAYVFYYNIHHIISDGWSMDVLSKDVLAYYEAYKENKEPALKALRIQYKDYSAWQLCQLEQESFKAHKAYWLNSLAGELPLLDLPGTKQRPRIKTNNGHGLSAYIDETTTARLKKYSEANGGSLFMGLLAAWNVLMYRYTSQTDVIVGTPTAGREHADLEDQIGFYVNTLALRNVVKPEESFDAFYQALKENTLKSYDHQMYPFDRLVEDLNLARDTSRSVVFDIMLILQNTGEKINGLALKKEEVNRIVDLGPSTSKFDIELSVEEIGGCLSLQLVYNPDVYKRDMIEALINHYKQLLNALLEDPGEKISQIDYLSQDEKHKLLITFNDTAAAYPKDKTLADLFEAQAERTPNNIAAVFEEKELTYKMLNEQANSLAAYLKNSHQIGKGDIVGVSLERTLDYVMVLLAIQKASACCSPINPGFPTDRLAAMLPNFKMVVDSAVIEDFRKAEAGHAIDNPERDSMQDDLAYVIYTSGSTGEPKGVMIEHAGIVNHLYSKISLLDFNAETVFLHASKMYFVGGIWQLWAPLIAGGRIVITTDNALQDISALLDLSRKNKVKILEVIPSQISNLFSMDKKIELDGIEKLILTGEPLKKDLVENILALNPRIEIINTYGQTECSDVTSMYKISAKEAWDHRLVGRPVQNTMHYIFDGHGLLCPVGVAGEIYTSGICVSRGYLNKEALTKEKFMAHPFRKNELMYKTGDLGRWTKDGSIEFIGRKDQQVKIRGYRIELGEIEHALLKHEQVKEAVVLARDNQNNEKELVAYITAKEKQNTAELRTYLKAMLPDYMLPAHFVQLEELPLTSNGKIDKKALPDPQGLGLGSGTAYVAPRNETEEKLVTIWQDILQRENIGVKDDFFALGGHSLKAMRLLTALKNDFGVKLDINSFFNNPTIEHTAMAVNFYLNQQQIKLNPETLREIEL